MLKTKVFKSGNSQAVRIPKEFNLSEKELVIQKIGRSIILTPINDKWSSLRLSLTLFTDDVFFESRQQPGTQKREDF